MGSASSSSGGTGNVDVSCYLASQFVCTKTSVPASTASLQNSGCTAEGGDASTSCPSSDLMGCCTITVAGYGSETCFYTGSDTSAADAQAECSASSGTWSTTP